MQCWLCSFLPSQKGRAQLSAGLHGFPGWNQAFVRLLPGFFYPCLSRVEQGCTAQPTCPMASLPLSLRGWGLTSQLSGLLNLSPSKTFSWYVGKSHNPHSQTPGTWSLTSLALGWRNHFHRVWFAPAPTKRRNSHDLRWACLGLLFLWWPELPLVQELSQADSVGPRHGWKLLFFRPLISKVTNQQTKTFPKSISTRLKEETLPCAHQPWYSGVFIFPMGK